MKVVHENTTFVQASELRTHLDEILKQVSKSRVVLEKHHKPVAVLVDPKKYEEMEDILEGYSDLILALEARKREKRKNKKYIPLEEVMKRVGLK